MERAERDAAAAPIMNLKPETPARKQLSRL